MRGRVGIDAQRRRPIRQAVLAGDQVLDARRRCGVRPRDLSIAEMEPEFVRVGATIAIAPTTGCCVGRLLDETDDVVVVDGRGNADCGLLKRRIGAPQSIERGDIGLDVAGLVPVARADFVFLSRDIPRVRGIGVVLD